VAVFAVLTWAFADGQFSTLWDKEDWTGSAIFTVGFMGLIVLTGYYQARRLPDAGIALAPATDSTIPGQLEDPKSWKLLLGNTYLALFWLPLRFFIGREWLSAGYHKLADKQGTWMNGTALKGYWTSAVAVPEAGKGNPKISYDWYRNFLQYMLDHHWYTWFADVIAVGEFLIGIGLIVGGLVAIAAFFGTLMNFNFMLAGSSSSNPVLFALSVFIILGWKVAGFWGLDRVLLPYLGAPWKPGKLLHHEPRATARSAA